MGHGRIGDGANTIDGETGKPGSHRKGRKISYLVTEAAKKLNGINLFLVQGLVPSLFLIERGN